jgi:tryptophan synthase beta chain
VNVPDAWYNVLPDLGFELPRDLPSPNVRAARISPQVPTALVRQETSDQRWISIPGEVLDRYRRWRPTPLRRASGLEAALGTRARIYYKYEGGNLSGSHKLNTAVAQAHYYRKAGARRLAVGTGAGQWGTAVAAACEMVGLECRVYMVRSSFHAKPYRRTIMEMLGASVVPSPSRDTEIGRRHVASGEHEDGSLSLALAEALEEAGRPGTRFCTGSGENYSLLHQTVIGLEAAHQLEEHGEQPDVLVAGLGAGSNLGGLCLPFLSRTLRGGRRARCVSVEPAACPKLTRGRYAYDYTDSSEQTPLQKMYTLGHTFAAPAIHAGGLRYHATSKLLSALYDRGLIEAVAYQQRQVFESAVLFSRVEGVVPAPESAHAVHGAVVEARRADERGETPVIAMSLSGHGLFDMAAYGMYLEGRMEDVLISDGMIERSLAQLPAQPVTA